ncbi:MAG: cupin domain-containing protein [Pirellulales bacterium]
MNLFDRLPNAPPEELFQTLVRTKNVRIERIVSHGHASPTDFWYDQDEHEFVLVLQGAARLQFVDSMQELRAGDWVDISAHRKHRVDWTTPDEPTIWLAVFYAPDP